MEQTKQQFNWKWRFIATALIVATWFSVGYFWQYAEGGVTGQMAVGQLNDSVTGYAAARAASNGSFVPNVIGWTMLVLLGIVWIPGLVKLVKSQTALAASLILSATLLAGCGFLGPAEVRPLEEIKPNETAFLVPLEGDSKGGQGKFMSVDYLESAKVATKRIEIPIRKRNTGRGPGDFEWVPTMKVIKVDRTPVTREWTKGNETGTSTSNQAVAVESLDSINFRVGVNCTGMITEDDAAKYLYHFAGKPLDQVMDSNVRGFIQSVMSREFGTLSLTNCKKEKGTIFKTLALETTDHFKPLGLTISNLGSSEGLLYDDPTIQASINKAYVAEMDIQVADQEKQAQEIRNKTNVGIAVAQREAAQEFAKAREASVERIKLEVSMKYADAALKTAEATMEMSKHVSNVTLPSVVQPGSTVFGTPIGQPATK
ncbi:hypothetical protein EPO05_04350 [Patescibacteria group bacterium]|nr:MAG: hypothetical protein EPO05_04350 [Patescibacteria group bacterium]